MQDPPKCFLCKSPNTFDFFQLPPVPTQDGIMCTSEKEAMEVVKGKIDLRFCQSCGFICNEGYDSSKISFDDYDFSNDGSPLFRKYVEDLADRLIQQYDLNEKTVLDIGCGDGVFLKVLTAKGNNKGIGIDPGFDFSKHASENDQIQYIRDYYSDKYEYLRPNFIACRLVIDLLDDQASFVKMVRKNLDNCPDTIVYFEVPNAAYTFEDRIIWNVVYEHKAWFTPDSFAFLFEANGFEVLNVAPCWNDEFLGIEARPKPMESKPKFPPAKNIQMLSETIADFNADFEDLIRKSLSRIEQVQNENIKTIAWGAGARAVTFFNLFDIKNEVPYIIDINTNRHGKFLPGSGQQIVAPEFIHSYQPDLVIITNPTYAEEIMEHARRLRVKGEFWVL